MGFFSKDIKTMDDLFVHTLRDIYYAEKQIVQALDRQSERSAAQARLSNAPGRDQATRDALGTSLQLAR